MAVDVGELIASISFDTSEMLKGIDRANNYLSKFSGKFTEVTKAIDNQTSVMEGSFRELGNSIGITYEKVVQSNDKLIRANEKTAKSFSDMTASFRAVRNDIQGLGDSLQKGLTAVGKGAAAQAKTFEESTQIMERGINRMSAAGEKMSGALSTNTRTVTSAVTGMGQNVKSSIDNMAKSVEMFGIRSANALENFQLRVQELQAATIGALREIDVAFQALAKANTRAAEVLQRSSAAMINSLRNLKNFADTTLRQMTNSFANFSASVDRLGGGSSLNNVVNELRKVQQEIARTNDLLRNSTISVRGFGDAGLSATGAVNNGFESTNRFTEGFMGKIRMVVMDLFFLQMAAQQAFGILTTVFGQGIKFAAEMETSVIGMAAVMSSSLNLDGQPLGFDRAMRISKTVIEDLKVEALRTTATLEELMTVYQAVLGPAAQLGMSLTQIEKFTVFGANAVKSLGLNHQQLVQELRSIVTGNITTRGSTLATALGITNEDIKNAEKSAEGVFGFLEKRMEGFKAAINETAGTFTAMWSNIMDGVQQTQEAAFTGMFKRLKKEMQLLQEVFFSMERHAEDVFDESGKKIFSKGDIKVESVQLNQDTIMVFSTLAKIVSDIYEDIKRFIGSLSSSELLNSLVNVNSVFFSIYGLIRTIYNSIYEIAGMSAIWFIATGSLRTIFMALVAITGNIERLIYLVQTHLLEIVAFMLSWRTIASGLTLLMTTLAGTTLSIGSVMASLGPIIAGAVGLLAIWYTSLNGINGTMDLIKANAAEIVTAIAGWQIAMVAATYFGTVGAAVVGVTTVVAILAERFEGLRGILEIVIQAIATLALTWGVLSGIVAVYFGILNSTIIAKTIATTVTYALNAAMVIAEVITGLWTIAVMALTGALGVLGIAMTVVMAKVIAIVAAILVLVAIIGTLIGAWQSVGGIIDWAKDKWTSLTNKIWNNTDALTANIQKQKEAASLQSSRAMLESMGLSPEEIARREEGGETAQQMLKFEQERRSARVREDLSKLNITSRFPGDDSGGAAGAKKENRIQEAIGKYNEAVIDAERKIAVEGYKNALKDLEEQFKDNRIGIGQYYSEQLRLNTLIKQAELDALKEKKAEEEKLEAIARGLGEEAKAINHATNAVKIEADIKTKLIEIDRLKTQSTIDQTKAYKDLNKELNKINLEFAKSHGGLTDEQIRNEVSEQYAETLKKITSNLAYLEDRKQKGIELTKEEIQTYNNLTLALKNVKISQEELAIQMRVDAIKRNQSIVESNADIKKTEVNNQYKMRLIDEWEAKQRIYDIENEEAKQLEITLSELLAKQKELVDKNLQSSDSYKNLAKDISNLRAKIVELKHPLSAIQEQIVNQFETSLGDAFYNIIMQTKSVSEAFRDMAKAVLASIAKIMANRLASSIVGNLFGGFGGGGSDAPSIISGGGAFGGIFRAQGGQISGPGTETSDSIPAMLSNGEFVLRAAAVRKIGVKTLNELNQYGTLPPLKFASGGAVTSNGSGGSNGGNSNMLVPNIKIEMINNSGHELTAKQGNTIIDGVNMVMSLWIEGVSNNVANSQDLIKQMGGRR